MFIPTELSIDSEYSADNYEFTTTKSISGGRILKPAGIGWVYVNSTTVYNEIANAIDVVVTWVRKIDNATSHI